MQNLNKKQAFTLIEILVVIAIIALLAAILFPVLSRARERARATTCMNNQHQIALALIQYTQDYGRRFPPMNDPGTDGWSVAIGIRDPSIFQCPSEEHGPSDGYTDYWINTAVLGLSDVRVRYPSNTILIGDGTAGPTGYNVADEGDSTSTPVIVAWDNNADYTTRHFDGANYAFVDGHVKWLKASSITVDDAASGNNFAFRLTPKLTSP